MPKDNSVPEKSPPLKWWKKLLKFTLIAFSVLFVLLVIILLLIRTPAVQQWITDKATNYITLETGAQCSIDKFYLSFRGNLIMEGFYLEDQASDTLVYAHILETGIAIRPLLKREIRLRKINLNQCHIRVNRSKEGVFNFDFLLSTFFSPEDPENIKDSGKSIPWKFSLSPIVLSDIFLQFNDTYAGMEVTISLKYFEIELNPFISDALPDKISNLHIDGLKLNATISEGSEAYQQMLSDLPIEEDLQEFEIPELQLDKLSLNDLIVTFDNKISKEEMALKLSFLNLDKLSISPSTGLTLNNKLLMKQLVSEGLVFEYYFREQDKTKLPTDDDTAQIIDFEWPNWDLESEKILLTDYEITYSSIEKKGVQPLEFETDNLHLKIDTLFIPEISFSDKFVQSEIRQLILSDHSGLNLKNTGMILNLDNKKTKLSKININTGKSLLIGDLEFRYQDIYHLLQEPESLEIFARINQLIISPDELLVFQRDLNDNIYFKELLPYPLKVSTTIEGNLKRMQIRRLKGSVLRQTRFNAIGELTDLLGDNGPGFDFPFVNLYSIESDLLPFIKLPENYRLPERFRLNGSLSGDFENLLTNLKATIPEGSLSIAAELSDLNSTRVYRLDLIIDYLNTAIYTDSLGPEMIAGKITLNGSGFDPYSTEMELHTILDSLSYRGKKLAPLHLSAGLSDGNLQLDGKINSNDINIAIVGTGKIDSLSYEIEFATIVNQLDLNKWEISTDSIIADARFFLFAKGSKDETTARLTLDTLFLQSPYESYLLDNLTANLDFSSSHTAVEIDSRLLKLNIRANSSPDLIASGINNYILTYWTNEVPDSALIDNLEVYLDMSISESEMLMEVIIPGLTALEETTLDLQFNQAENSLTGMWLAPYIVYEGIELIDVYAGISSDKSDLDWETGFYRINFGEYGLPQGKISGIFSSEKLHLEVDIISDEQDQLVLFGLEALNVEDKFIISLNPDRLIFNTYPWSIDEKNKLEVGAEYISINNFRLHRGNHSFSMESHPGNKNDFLKLNFENIDLEGLLQLISPEQSPVGGELTGQLILDNIFEKPTVLADIEIQDLSAMDKAFGNLNFYLKNPKLDNYLFEAILKGEEIEMLSEGEIELKEEEGMRFNVRIDLLELKFDLIEWLAEGEIYDSKGYLAGSLNIEGSPYEINWSGLLQFREIAFTTRETRSVYSIPNEEIFFSQSAINFRDFRIMDAAENPTTINGTIDIATLTRPAFDLNIVSSDFKFLESTREDNDFIFGKAILDLNIALKGDLNTPQIEANFFLKRGSVITLIVPETQIDIIEREGVVVIEKRVAGQVVQDDTEPEELMAPLFVGIDLNSVIRVHPEAILRIVVDERAGDLLEVAGEGNLSFNLDPLGRMSLSGIYELNRGYYEMRMYDIVRRRFELSRGSRLIWSGDPMEADMHIRAVYRVRTSPLDLMSSQLAGADQSLRNQYRQELPFDVIMNLEGMMLQPDLSFQMDMPETARAALGGNVYRRINQLNQSESELNTQVFSLLVLGRFLSEGIMAEEPRGIQPEAMARSSASRLLTSQLNALSDRYIRGIDLDFDLESFTDYRSGIPEDRTQLSLRMQRSLLDDRLTIQVSGQVDLEGTESDEGRTGSELLGDVSIEYRLTEDSRWNLRGFRKNQYEGIIEGQVVVTGISLLFNRDFNSFAELFSRKNKH